jgi:hypothetical protein
MAEKPLPKPTHAKLSQTLEKHLFYEAVRFITQYNLLRAPDYRGKLDAKVAEEIDDALIVSFCTHARNLLEFFFRPSRTEYNYAIATDYADQSYVRLDRDDPDVARLYGQLCAQINHLTYDRTDESSKKINPKERDELVALIHDEVVRLEPHLSKVGFDKGYLAIERLAEAKAKTLMVAPGAMGATNAITVLNQVTHSTAPLPPSVPVSLTGPPERSGTD